MKLPNCDMSRWHVPVIRVQVIEDHDPTRVVIRVLGSILDVETRNEGEVVHQEVLPKCVLDDPGLLRLHIQVAVKTLVAHEVDECLYVDGVRLCKDPHPELKRYAG